MRHRVAHRKLGRVTEHRMAMLRNQAMALLSHEKLTTTVARAKELRPFVERLITIAKRGGLDGTGPARGLHARRLVMHDVQDREVVKKLFDTIAPRFAGRSGGYTRLLRIGFRRGDAAEIAQVELVGSEFNPRATAETEAKKDPPAPKPTGVGGRLRAAADRLRRKKGDESGEGAAAETRPEGVGRGKGKAKAADKAKQPAKRKTKATKKPD